MCGGKPNVSGDAENVSSARVLHGGRPWPSPCCCLPFLVLFGHASTAPTSSPYAPPCRTLNRWSTRWFNRPLRSPTPIALRFGCAIAFMRTFPPLTFRSLVVDCWGRCCLPRRCGRRSPALSHPARAGGHLHCAPSRTIRLLAQPLGVRTEAVLYPHALKRPCALRLVARGHRLCPACRWA